MTENRYEFSIIMAVYNTADYLEEAIDSVINQTIGFEDNIQLILINDGSTDDTEEICLRYQNSFPDNIVYMYKENGGVSSARNIGLDLAEGRYVNFLDSDDLWKLDTFENVYRFFEQHENETDVVTCRTFLFGLKNVAHKLNYKYKEDGVWSLDKAPAYSQCAAGNVFFLRSAIGDLRFDEELRNAEDALFLNTILLEKCTIGLVSSGGYLYRKREGSSEYASSKYNRIVIQPGRFGLGLYELSRKRYGAVKPFIAYTVMYEMQYRLTEEPSPDITKAQLKGYERNLKTLLEEIPDRYIWRQREMLLYKKALTFRLKHGDDFYRHVEWKDRAAFYGKDKVYSFESFHRLRFHSMKREGGTAVLQGFTDTACMGISFEIYAMDSRGNRIDPLEVSSPEREVRTFNDKVLIPGEEWSFCLPMKEGEKYSFYVAIEGQDPIRIIPGFETEQNRVQEEIPDYWNEGKLSLMAEENQIAIRESVPQKSEMSDIQKRLLTLMDEFDHICRENDIEYFFAGGTALGAVRNGGFLPWDDDADVLIKRSEYEKLNRVMSRMEFKDRAWITEENSPTYLNPTPRYFDLGSTDILESRLDYGAPKGCQLEVFIMDPFPSEKEKQIEFIKYLWLYSELTNNYLLYGSLRMPDKMLDPELFYEYKKRLERESVDSIKQEILDKITYPEEECEYWCGRWSCMPYVFKKEWMGSQRFVDFEGRQFPVPLGVFYEMVENYDMNWDMIPPKSKQKIHPSIKSADVSYLEMEDSIRDWCDEVDYNELLYANKADRVERIFARNSIEKDFALIRQQYLARIAEELNKRQWSFDRAGIDELEKEFEEYFLAQFKYSYSKYGLKVPLNEELLETMILTLIHRDRIEHASLLNDLFTEYAIHEKYGRICETLADLKIKKYEEDLSRVREYLDLLEEYEEILGQVEIERASLWLLTRGESLNVVEIEKIAADCTNPSDLEIQKYIGDLYWNAGQEALARERYDQVCSGSRNGMILYDLKKRGLLKS